MEIDAATAAAASAWSSSGDPCTYLSISVTPSMATPPRAVNDHRNAIIFRKSSWCELQSDGTCSADIGAYDPSALAVTSVVASKQTGQIRDADIEINGFHHPWGDLVAHPELFAADPRTQDLQNALTHEMGHLIGLDHTCVPAGTLPRPTDNLGNPVPDCSTASADVQATTMFPSAQAGDTEKRTLAPDDQQAVCEIYPAANDPMVCMPYEDPAGCGCAAGGARGTTSAAGTMGLALAFALACLPLLRARRRRGAGR